MQHVETMLKQKQTRLALSLDELRTFDAGLARKSGCHSRLMRISLCSAHTRLSHCAVVSSHAAAGRLPSRIRGGAA